MIREIENIRQTYSQVFVIVSPPRCSSTALARVFWEHPLIRYYSHEPFETVYYLHQGLNEVFERLNKPLDLKSLKKSPDNCIGGGIIIKEMPYQVGSYFEMLVNLATAPIIFLIRDPRLNVSSRMRKKIEIGDSPIFPLIETGWKLLESQVAFCQFTEIPYLVVDSRDFRNRPGLILNKLFTRLHLSFSEDFLFWKPHPNIDIDNLYGKHTHLYTKVLQSDRLIPDQDPIPSIESFPEDNGLRQHITECLGIYTQLKKLVEFITSSEETRRI